MYFLRARQVYCNDHLEKTNVQAETRKPWKRRVYMHFCLHICKITLEGYVQKQTMHALWEGNWCGWVAKDGRETSL